MSVGLNMMENPLLLSFLPFLSSFFDFGRQISKFFLESIYFQPSFHCVTVGTSLLFKRFYGFFEWIIEAFMPRIPSILRIIPQHITRVGNELGKHRKS